MTLADKDTWCRCFLLLLLIVCEKRQLKMLLTRNVSFDRRLHIFCLLYLHFQRDMRVTASCLFVHMWADHVGTKCAFATGISCMCFPKQAHSRLNQTWLHFHWQVKGQTQKARKSKHEEAHSQSILTPLPLYPSKFSQSVRFSEK